MKNPSNPEKSRPLWKSRSSRQPTSSRYLFCDKHSSVLQFGGNPCCFRIRFTLSEATRWACWFLSRCRIAYSICSFCDSSRKHRKPSKKPREFNNAWARLAFSPSWGWNQEATEGGSFTIPLRNCFEPFAWDLYLKALCSEFRDCLISYNVNPQMRRTWLINYWD